jgi:two-component response regulator ARR-B family
MSFERQQISLITWATFYFCLVAIRNTFNKSFFDGLQKYRLYLKRLSADASRQANLTAAFGGRNPAYVNMGLDAFRQYNAYGRYRPVPTTNHSQPNNLLARMNSPAFGMHGLLPSQPLQIGHNQNNLSTSLGNVGGMNNGNLIRGAHMPLQDTSKCFPTGPSGNSFANISNSTQLVTTNNLPLQSLEPSNQQHLGRLHSSADPFNSFVGEPPQFADLGRCNTTWPTAVSSSNVQEIGQKDRIVNRPKLEPLSSFTEASSQIPLLGSEMQSHQVASLASNGLPMPFTQEAVPFAYGSSTNSREMLNNNLALSNSGVNSTLPNLRIDGSVVPGQTLGGSNSGGCVVPPLQDGRIDHQAVSSHLNYNNELMGTGRLQRGLSGGLDDIVVDMFRPVWSYTSFFLYSRVVSITAPYFYVNHAFFFQCRTAQTMASPSLMGTGNWSSKFQFSTSSLPSCEIFRICGCGGVRRLIGPKLFIVARLHHKCPLHLVFQFSDQVPVSRPNINYVVFATLTRMAMFSSQVLTVAIVMYTAWL